MATLLNPLSRMLLPHALARQPYVRPALLSRSSCEIQHFMNSRAVTISIIARSLGLQMTDEERAVQIYDRVRQLIDKHGYEIDNNDPRRYVREPFSFTWRDPEAGGLPGLFEVWKNPGGKLMSLEWAEGDPPRLIRFRPGDWTDGLDWLLL